MIADAHHRHDRKHETEHPDMDRDEEDERGDDDRAGYRLQRVKAHRRPGGRRAARVVDRMGEPKQARPVPPAMGPIEPCAVGEEIDEQAERTITERNGGNARINARPAVRLPPPGDDTRPAPSYLRAPPATAEPAPPPPPQPTPQEIQ